jgi:RNA polymerase sigma-70 factor (ECF subfamily)
MEAEAVAMSVIPATSRQDTAAEPRQLTGQRLPEAFERLFVTEYPRVVAIANRVLASRPEAEEVAQEVFLQFHRSHDAEASYAAAWLHRAAWHSALNVVRGNRRRQVREQANRLPEDHAAADPQEIVERAEQRRMVRMAMRRLPRKSAAVLALRYSGLSYAEVANALGVSIGQVGTLLRRAESRLRTEVTNATP